MVAGNFDACVVVAQAVALWFNLKARLLFELTARICVCM